MRSSERSGRSKAAAATNSASTKPNATIGRSTTPASRPSIKPSTHLRSRSGRKSRRTARHNGQKINYPISFNASTSIATIPIATRTATAIAATTKSSITDVPVADSRGRRSLLTSSLLQKFRGTQLIGGSTRRVRRQVIELLAQLIIEIPHDACAACLPVLGEAHQDAEPDEQDEEKGARDAQPLERPHEEILYLGSAHTAFPEGVGFGVGSS